MASLICVQHNSIQCQLNSIQFNLVHFSSVQFSSFQFSSVQFSSVQFSSVQFSSVQFSQFNVISFRYVSFRFVSLFVYYTIPLYHVLYCSKLSYNNISHFILYDPVRKSEWRHTNIISDVPSISLSTTMHRLSINLLADRLQ